MLIWEDAFSILPRLIRIWGVDSTELGDQNTDDVDKKCEVKLESDKISSDRVHPMNYVMHTFYVFLCFMMTSSNGNLRRNHVHYDVTVMSWLHHWHWDNQTIIREPVKLPWGIWGGGSHKSILENNINSLAPGKSECEFINEIFRLDLLLP